MAQQQRFIVLLIGPSNGRPIPVVDGEGGGERLVLFNNHDAAERWCSNSPVAQSLGWEVVEWSHFKGYTRDRARF